MTDKVPVDGTNVPAPTLSDVGQRLWKHLYDRYPSSGYVIGDLKPLIEDVTHDTYMQAVDELRKNGLLGPEDAPTLNAKGVMLGLDNLIEESKTEQGRLSELLDQVREEQQNLANELSAKIHAVEGDFYRRIIPMFGAFVAVLALIITGTQTVMRITSDAPILIFEQAIAVMGPITLLLALLIAFIWLLVRR